MLALSGCAGASPYAYADAQLYLEQHLDAAWRAQGVKTDRPNGGTPLFVLPDGWPLVMAACMVDSGFPDFTYSRDDGFRNGASPRDESGEQGLAWYYCARFFPTSDVEFARLDPAELDRLYAYYSGWLAPCLEANGVGDVYVPTRSNFDGSWNPYLGLAEPPSTDLTDLLLEKCPAYPSASAP